jgi:hypothetical protein
MLAVLLGAIVVWTGMGQGVNPVNAPRPTSSAPEQKPASSSKPLQRDIAKLSVSQRNFYLSAQRGADWLQRANRPDGRFVYGYLPSLRAPMDGENYVHQIGAAFALARAARFFHDDKAAALATHALLALLLDTAVDPKEPHVRYTALPPALVNRVTAAGMLVMAIHELPQPGKDLLDQADQLCNYLRKQQAADGSIAGAESDAGKEEGQHVHAGPALYGLLRSCQHRPAPWKLDVVRKARTYYHAWWHNHKNVACVPWLSAAYTEAYLQSREQAFAVAVFEMNDWLCTLQYHQLDPRRPLWIGGFMTSDAKALNHGPQISSAAAAQSLVEACRTARQAADVTRHQRYTQALEKGLQFVTTLQYTDANTQHFAEWYRPLLVGAFHLSHQEGDLRLDYTQHAVSALVQYLHHVADLR